MSPSVGTGKGDNLIYAVQNDMLMRNRRRKELAWLHLIVYTLTQHVALWSQPSVYSSSMTAVSTIAWTVIVVQSDSFLQPFSFALNFT